MTTETIERARRRPRPGRIGAPRDTDVAAAQDGDAGSLRIGSVEEAILEELHRSGGPVPRRLLVAAVFASSIAAPMGAPDPEDVSATLPRRARPHAESTLSRALRSLERKRLIVRAYNRLTGQTLVTVTNPPDPPDWECDARAEEAFAAHCDNVSTQLAELARRARSRAIRLRLERRRIEVPGGEHDGDVARWKRLMSVGIGGHTSARLRARPGATGSVTLTADASTT